MEGLHDFKMTHWDHEPPIDRSADAHIRVALSHMPELADVGIRAPMVRFMESLHLQDWTRIGAMNRKGAAASASASWSAAVLCRFRQRVAFAKRQRTAALQNLAAHSTVHGET